MLRAAEALFLALQPLVLSALMVLSPFFLAVGDRIFVTPTPTGELPIVQKTYDLIKWYVPILNRLPRDHKFGLGDRMVAVLYDLLEGFITARYAASFVGFRVLPDRIRVRNHNLQTGRRRLKRLQAAYGKGQISEHDFTQRFQSWNAHLSHGNTWRLRQHIFRNLKLPHPLK